jgi:chorismate-pyruvate lyase
MNTAAQSASLQALAFPLTDFYAHAGLPLPPIEIISGDAVPEPCKGLLVQNSEVTPMLEAFHKSRIHLEIIKRDQRGSFYLREVVLRLDHDEKPVGFVANKIFLGRFPEEAQEFILAEQIPFGRILKDCGMQHRIEVKAFFRLEPDAVISEALELENPVTLYGRKAIISDLQGRPLSEKVEILSLTPEAKK